MKEFLIELQLEMGENRVIGQERADGRMVFGDDPAFRTGPLHHIQKVAVLFAQLAELVDLVLDEQSGELFPVRLDAILVGSVENFFGGVAAVEPGERFKKLVGEW